MAQLTAKLSAQTGLLTSLAQFRHALHSFLSFSEHAAHDRGLQPRQYQLLLQIAGLPAGRKATIGVLAERLSLRQNSVVELADRSAAEGLVRRTEDPEDRRRVVLSLTVKGERVLKTLAASHARELNELGPQLIRALEKIGRARNAVTGKAGVQRPASRTASKHSASIAKERVARPAVRRNF